MSEENNLLHAFLGWFTSQKENFAIMTGIIVSGMWGGFIRYIAHVKKNHVAMQAGEFFFEMMVSSFAGGIPGFLIYGLTSNVWLTCAASAYAGHIGTRQVFKILNAVINKKIQ